MKIVVQTLAADDQYGTRPTAFATEDDLYRHLYETVIEESWALERRKPTLEKFLEDPWDYIDKFRHDELDTYSADEVVLDVPIRKIIHDSLQHHPAVQGLARHCRATLRLARQVFGRADRSHPA
ncbi:MAG: hypothetical protein EOR77_21430 [Mesorhizobium sp.]|uniref:hypothetical protein n=1 Tax=Mesorhizobium sp. TaxID=1871066 RepID=UPI000FEA63A1|nr:hypothetical protein [Mesorhizobium sp.]RWM32595.1 MAG: hypothetical protein EOR77_21430 [Mesorhizobium sp.]